MTSQSVPAFIGDLQGRDMNGLFIDAQVTNRDMSSSRHFANARCEFIRRQRADYGIKRASVRLTVNEMSKEFQIRRQHRSH